MVSHDRSFIFLQFEYPVYRGGGSHGNRIFGNSHVACQAAQAHKAENKEHQQFGHFVAGIAESGGKRVKKPCHFKQNRCNRARLKYGYYRQTNYV